MPESWVVVVVTAMLGFLIGSVSPATIIAKARHVDLRQGSGNPGATNVGRVLGLRWGVVVGLLDVLKGFVPTFLAPVSYTHLRAHETDSYLVCRLLLEKKKKLKKK